MQDAGLLEFLELVSDEKLCKTGVHSGFPNIISASYDGCNYFNLPKVVLE
jgi:hypothetical protein